MNGFRKARFSVLAAMGLFIGQQSQAITVPVAPEPAVDAPARTTQGGRVSLQDAVAIATSQVPGRVVRAETVTRNGRRVHEILIINDDGVVRTVRVDEATGDVF